MCKYPSLLLFAFIFFILGIVSCTVEENPKFKTGDNWPIYLGDKHNSHYSPLTQINKENIDEIQVAWEYKTGDSDPKGNTPIQCNPIIIDGILYGSTPKLKIFALDAASGEQIWIYDPAVATNFSLNVNRGVTYWEDGDDKRILFTAGPYLFALNAETGYPVQSFGIFGKA
ncbi:MAG: pyrroloquinoline quinone-dependent dehydrogenase, partial [Cyclobacteriaceae bacterium]|nr:pyrroloquinoline quinone-dependent dehydrogenase [Cyclobacteriaceae bacterium]